VAEETGADPVRGPAERLQLALAERHRADEAIRRAVRELVPDDATAEQPGSRLADILAAAVPGMHQDDVELAADTAVHHLADSASSTSSGPAQPPMPPPVVYLRGAGVDGRVFRRLRAALRSCGVWTTTNRTAAMHLSRGGLPVWMLDLSVPKTPAPATTPADPAAGDQVSISEMRAVYEPAPGGQQLVLNRVRGQRVTRPIRAGELDVDGLVTLVIRDLLAAPPATTSAQTTGNG
jgi:hypothetical protein